MSTPTADLCDRHGDIVRVVAADLRDFGGLATFSGTIATLRVHDDNALVRLILSEPGRGRVLVIDGAGSRRTALVGATLGQLAEDNGWSGVVVWGSVRDTVELRGRRIGVRALTSCPCPPQKAGTGERDVPVQIAGLTVAPGQWLAADADGIIVSDVALA